MSNKYTDNISLEIKDKILNANNTNKLNLIQLFIKSQIFINFVSYFFYFQFSRQRKSKIKNMCRNDLCPD